MALLDLVRTTLKGVPKAALGMALVAGAVVSTAGIATADTPGTTVTATPSTNLADSDTVSVSGSGFTVGGATVNIYQCKGNPATACTGVIGSVFTSDGTFSNVSVPVSRTFNGTDCGPEDNCTIYAEDAGGKSDSTPISFASVTPPPPVVDPDLTTTPTTGLADSDTVTASGTGFTPGASLNFYQCKVVNGTRQSCGVTGSGVLTDDSGNFDPVSVPVTRIFNATQGAVQGSVDCGPEDTCILVASDSQGVEDSDPISFASLVAPVIDPEVTIDPSTDVPDPFSVDASGTGYTPGASLNFYLCKVVDGAQSCGPIGTGVMTDDAGAFGPVSVPVASSFTATQGPLAGQVVSCLPENTCTFNAVDSQAVTDGTPIEFAEPVVTPLDPTLTLEPNTELAASQNVTASGDGFAPQSTVIFAQCKPAEAEPGLSCDPIDGASVLTDENGDFSGYSLPVSRTFTATQGVTGPVDCLPENDCFIVATDSLGNEDRADIDFAEPVTPTDPTLNIDPNSELGDAQNVSATGSGFDPESTIEFRQCKPVNDSFVCINREETTPTDSEGNFSTTLLVTRTFTVQGTEYTCFDDCFVQASDGESTATAGISFGEVAPPPPPASPICNTLLSARATFNAMIDNFENLFPLLSVFWEFQRSLGNAAFDTVLNLNGCSLDSPFVAAGRARDLSTMRRVLPASVYSALRNPLTASLRATPVVDSTNATPATYTVQPGDTLTRIARQLLGSATRWRDLVNANPSLASNPSLIRPGQILVIPG